MQKSQVRVVTMDMQQLMKKLQLQYIIQQQEDLYIFQIQQEHIVQQEIMNLES